MTQAIVYNLQHISPGTHGHCKMTSVFAAVGTSLSLSSGTALQWAPLSPFPWVQLLLLLSSEPSPHATRLPCCYHLSLFLSNFTQCCVTMATMGQQFAEFY